VIILKTSDEIAAMRRTGQVVAEALRTAGAALGVGLRTSEIEAIVAGCLATHGAIPLLLGAPGPSPFPATACVSVNDEIAHGVPGERRLAAGDVVSIDTACRLDGWCADAAWTWVVGSASGAARRLIDTGRDALERAIAACRPGVLWADVAEQLETCVRERGCALVAGVAGHGIGRELHEDPQVPNSTAAGRQQSGFRLEPGLVLAIEPTVTNGSGHVRRAANGWTLATADGQPAAHFEHTIAVTDAGPLVLTAGIEG
jgi:methionyl aminopeptidase